MARWTGSASVEGQIQSNRSEGGGRGAGTSVGSPRWVRMRRMTTGSSMLVTTRIRPPQRAHANTSTPNVCRMRSGHDHPRRPDDVAGANGPCPNALVQRRRHRIKMTHHRPMWHETAADGGGADSEAAARVGAPGGA